MSLKKLRDVLYFEEPETAIVDWDYLFNFFTLVADFLSNYLDPAVARYRASHNMSNFKKAIEIWVSCCKENLTIWECLRKFFGYYRSDFYYYLRWLGLYMTYLDAIRLRQKFKLHIQEGWLYFVTKVEITGSYGGSNPFEYQIETSVSAPCFEVSTRGLQINSNYLLMLTEEFLQSSDLSASLVETIVSNWEVKGITLVLTGFFWSFERRKDVRWCLCVLQKQNLYGGYAYYEYYIWGVRLPWPSTELEFVTETESHFRIPPGAKTCAIVESELTSKELVEEIKEFKEKAKERAKQALPRWLRALLQQKTLF